MNRNIRITALALAILAFFIFVGSPFGQTAKAVGVTGSIISIIIAALAALGITITAASGWDTVNDYVQELLNEYADSRGISYSGLFSGVQSGTNSLGQILLNNRFVLLINGFAAWLKVKLGLIDNNVVNVMPTLSLSGVTLFYMNTYYVVTDPTTNVEYILYFYRDYSVGDRIDDAYVFYRYDENGYYTCVCSSRSLTGGFNEELYNANFELQLGSYGRQDITNYNGNGVYYYIASGVPTNYRPEGIVPFVGDYYALRDWIDRASFVESTDIQVITGSIVLPEDDSSYNQGDGAIVDLNADWGMTYGEVVDDIPSNYEDAEITYEAETEVIDQVEDTPSQMISNEASEYQSPGLPDVFPFCIPFDIYAFFECLAADPVAPSFTWRFYVPGICDEEIELDLAEFDMVAQIVRTMELLAFIVGLALVTRNRFLRG